VDPDVAVMHKVLEDVRAQLFKEVEILEDADLNRTFPGLQNTIGILLRHMAGSERYWISGVAGGGSLDRDREAEFVREPLAKGALLNNLRATQAATEGVLSRLGSDELRGSVEVQGARGTWKATRAWAILHAIQHLAYHLGQVRLMAGMARHSREAGSG
jgi:uncharacterized damage-inducible protein DinB